MLLAISTAMLSAPALGQAPDAMAPGAMAPDAMAPVDLQTPPPALTQALETAFAGDQTVDFDRPHLDVFGMGQEVDISAYVADNALLMAEEITVSAPVDGDVFAMGKRVRIIAPVAGDVYSMGAEVEITADAPIGGNVFALAEKLRISAPVSGDLSARAETVILASTVHGDADLGAANFVVRDDGRIAGDLAYVAEAELPALEAVVAGSSSWSPGDEDFEGFGDHEESESGIVSQALGWSLWTSWSYVSKLLVGFVILAVGGASATGAARVMRERPGQSLGWGLLLLFGLPALSVLMMVTIVPLPLGILGMMLFGVTLYVAQILTAQMVGDLILRRFRPDAVGRPYISMAVGLLPLVILVSVPWIGSLAWFLATLAGVGGFVLAMRGHAAVVV